MPREDLIQVRRGTTAEWAAADPILDDGEPGQDTETLEYKVGNGVDAWSVLPAINDTGIPSGPAGGALGGTYPNPTLSAGKQAELDGKAPIASPTFTGTVAGVTKGMVGLGNVDNTSDANKPVSTAQQTALDAKVAKSLYDANTLLVATNDNDPAPLSMGASTIVARLASGGIVAATPAQIAALLPASGGAYSNVIDDPSMWPATVGLADQEFNLGTFTTPVTSLPAGLAYFNQGGASYSESLGAGMFNCPVGTLELRGIVASLSGAPATWDHYIKWEPTLDQGTAYIEAGILMREAATGKAIQMGIYTANDGGIHPFILSWSSNTGASFSVGPLTTSMGQAWKYWRIRKNSSTSYDYMVSRDGKQWWIMLAGASPGFTPDQVGFGISANSAAQASMAVQWMRLR